MHTHKWKETYTTLDYRYDMLRFECIECKEVMLIEEIERRLNAVEMLTAEQAYSIGKEGPRGETAIGPLLAYSRILEGETT